MKLRTLTLTGAFALVTAGLLAGCGQQNNTQPQPQPQPKPFTGDKVTLQQNLDRYILEFAPKNAPGKVCVTIAGAESTGLACFNPAADAEKLPAVRVLENYQTQVGSYTRSILEFNPKSDAGELCVAVAGPESSSLTCFPAAGPGAP